MDLFQVKAFPGRQGFCVRERSTPPGNEVAAAVTRGHPARLMLERVLPAFAVRHPARRSWTSGPV